MLVHELETRQARTAIADADVIVGKDIMSEREFLIYGREFLERIVQTGQKEKAKRLVIELDQETQELEYACAAVQVLKGQCDYST